MQLGGAALRCEILQAPVLSKGPNRARILKGGGTSVSDTRAPRASDEQGVYWGQNTEREGGKGPPPTGWEGKTSGLRPAKRLECWNTHGWRPTSGRGGSTCVRRWRCLRRWLWLSLSVVAATYRVVSVFLFPLVLGKHIPVPWLGTVYKVIWLKKKLREGSVMDSIYTLKPIWSIENSRLLLQ